MKQTATFYSKLQKEIEELKKNGLYKEERIITSSQSGLITIKGGKKVLNFCANNYLGLANHQDVIKAAKEGLDQYGYGLASVRFICGTQNIHKTLEEKISAFLKTDDTILHGSCFDANGGLFEALLGEEDAIISDSLNHASIIDGVRLCKAKRFRYQNNDMKDLEEKLKEASTARFRVLATDGVFSMDGIIANLPAICDLAKKYDALVMVDDSHATGFMGEHGRGTHEYHKVIDQIDILTGTLGKALGGASGGYVSGKKEIIEWLRQRSRPYLFSNTLAPSIAVGTLKVFEILEKDGSKLIEKLFTNAKTFRQKMTALGFRLAGKDHPIIPVMLGDAKLGKEFAKKMLEEGIYVIGFSYPVVPQGQARIRTQISAAHSLDDIEAAVRAFEKVGKGLKIIPNEIKKLTK